MARAFSACSKLALAGALALFASTASGQSDDVGEDSNAPATAMGKCLDRVASRITSKSAPLRKPDSYAECFLADEIRDAEDVLLRFSSTPALGGIGYEISIRPLDGRLAAVRVLIVSGHPGTGWIGILSAYSDISRTKFEALRRSFEAAIAADPVSLESVDSDGNRVLVVCTDGPGYLAEVFDQTGRRSLEGFCGDHPNKKIAAEIEKIKSEVLSEFASRPFRR